MSLLSAEISQIPRIAVWGVKVKIKDDDDEDLLVLRESDVLAKIG